MKSIELSAGAIDYLDTGGDGPTLVFIHGLVMNDSLWHQVIDGLQSDHRCIAPVLPLGGHRTPMRADADLSLHGQASLLAELIEKLDLHDVTLVSSDWGGPQITAVEHPERLSALVLLSQEAFDNIPPGLPGTFAALSGRLPGGIAVAVQTLRVPLLRRLPITFGWMAKRPIHARGHDQLDRRAAPSARRPARRRALHQDQRQRRADERSQEVRPFRSARAGAVGFRGPDHAPGARPAPREAVPERTTRRSGRQLHAHTARCARSRRVGDPPVRGRAVGVRRSRNFDTLTTDHR